MVSHKRAGALSAPAESVTDLAVGSSDWLGQMFWILTLAIFRFAHWHLFFGPQS